MADDRRDSSRTEFDTRPVGVGVRAGGATAELRTAGAGSGLSRLERHGGSKQQGAVSVKELEVPAKKAKLTFDKKYEEPEEEPVNVRALGEEEDDEDGEDERTYPRWAVVSFWLFRKSIVPVVMIVMLIVGLYAGYVILGDGPKDKVFEWSTWRHLYDLVFADS